MPERRGNPRVLGHCLRRRLFGAGAQPARPRHLCRLRPAQIRQCPRPPHRAGAAAGRLTDAGYQGEELEPARHKAELMGATEIFIDDLREEFVRDFVFPMFRANTLYEGAYLLGTSIARPLIAQRQIEIARQVGADAVAHGATGKGNDQVRFELSYYALEPDIKVIAPWRIWELTSRTSLLDYADQHQIPVARDR